MKMRLMVTNVKMSDGLSNQDGDVDGRVGIGLDATVIVPVCRIRRKAWKLLTRFTNSRVVQSQSIAQRVRANVSCWLSLACKEE